MTTKRQRKQWDDFLTGTFTPGGIFDEAAKVEFKEPLKKGPTLADLIDRQAGAAAAARQAEESRAAQIAKLEAYRDHPATSPEERATAQRLIIKLRQKANK